MKAEEMKKFGFEQTQSKNNYYHPDLDLLFYSAPKEPPLMFLLRIYEMARNAGANQGERQFRNKIKQLLEIPEQINEQP